MYQTHTWLDLCKGKMNIDSIVPFVSFRWLDKLGIAAVVGHKRVFRQDFVGGNYALVDKNQQPLPVRYNNYLDPNSYYRYCLLLLCRICLLAVQYIATALILSFCLSLLHELIKGLLAISTAQKVG